MRIWTLISTAILGLIVSVDCSALSVGTHRELNSYVLQNDPYIDNTLKNYNLPEGVRTQYKAIDPSTNTVKDLPILDIIANGGITEDGQSFTDYRYINHFHSPLKPWDQSALPKSLLIDIFCNDPISNPLWALAGPDVNSYSWPAARQYLYNALTATDNDTRNTNFVNCFRSVGQLMHIMQDMSVPAHVRDNSHADGNIYEIWVDNELNDLQSGPFDAPKVS